MNERCPLLFTGKIMDDHISVAVINIQFSITNGPIEQQ